MTARLGALIDSTLQAPGITAAVLADSAGHAIEGASRTDGDLAAAARSATDMLTQWASVGTEMRMGGVRSLLIERGGGSVMISPAPLGATFVVIGNQSCQPGRLRREARQRVGEVERLGAALVEHRTGPADSTNAATSPSARLARGEVVLIGAHTFRLVTNLVARLLQAKGVRSSRLRAYSPASTIIDVVLEEDVTLAGIGGSCFGDFPIEPVAQARNRLVLKVARAPVRPATLIGSPG